MDIQIISQLLQLLVVKIAAHHHARQQVHRQVILNQVQEPIQLIAQSLIVVLVHQTAIRRHKEQLITSQVQRPAV